DSMDGASPGTYGVHIATNTGCDTVLYLEIPDITPEVSFVVSDTLICSGDTIEVTSTSDTYFQAFQWDFGDGVAAADAVSRHAYTHPGAYQVSLTGEGDICIDSSFVTVIVDAPPTDYVFSVDKEAICVGDKIQFYPGADSTVTELFFDFGDGNYYST